MANENQFKKLLNELSSKSPLFPNNFHSIVIVYDNENVVDGFKKLVDNQIMCAPIVSHKTGKVMGVLTMRELLILFLDTFTDQDLNSAPMKTLIHKREEFKKMHAIDFKTGEDDPLIIVEDSATALKAAQDMKARNGHRAIVVDANQKPSNVITESRLLKIASVLLDVLPITKKTLKELNIGTKNVITIEASKNTRDAGVAVVDSSGKLVGNLSTRDIKFLGFDARYFDCLHTSVGNYLETMRIYDATRTIPDNIDPIRCTEDTSLGQVISYLTYYRIHRIFVVDKDCKPIGVVSLQDVLKVLLE